MSSNAKIKLHKIPSVCKNVPFPDVVSLSSTIPACEGSIIMVEAGEHEGMLNTLDFVGGRLGKLWKHDMIPAVLGYRKATTEFAGFVPPKVTVGDQLYLLCESGVVGAISGVFESWGKPMQVKVAGSIVDAEGNPMFLKQFAMPVHQTQSNKVPIIIFLGTRMDCGKTTMACKIGHELVTKQGKKVVGVKLTGVAFTQDLMKIADSGASVTYDFVDMGFPSTCNGDSSAIVQSALHLIDAAKQHDPDCILIEFGDAVLGEYHVADILKNSLFASQISMVLLAANDFAGIKGTKDILASWSISVDLVTGPIANSQVGVDLIKKYFHLIAESNQHDIPKTMQLIKEKLW